MKRPLISTQTGRRGSTKPFVTRGSAEVEDLLPCRPHTPANHVREEPAKPGSAREHVAVRGQGAAVAEPHVRPPAVRSDRRDRSLAVGSSNPHEFACNGIARVPGQEIAAFMFEVDLPDAVELDLRPSLRGDGRFQLLVFELEVAQEGQRLTRIAVVRARQPQDAGPPVELLARRRNPTRSTASAPWPPFRRCAGPVRRSSG